MSLNIKNEEAHKLAAELASLTGQSITQAVTEAIRLRLSEEKDRQSRQGMVGDLLRIGRHCASKLEQPLDSASHGDLLYDEKGLPK